jgi:hypothetical protein
VSDSETRATFILRLSRERSAPAGEWRGEVLHIQAGQTVHAVGARALFDFVCAQLADLEGGAGQNQPPLPGAPS